MSLSPPWDRRISGPVVGALLGLVVGLAGLGGLLDGWRREAEGLFSRLRGPRPSSAVLVVGVTERSLQSGAPWPWSAEVLTRLVTRLDEAGVRAAALDLPLGRLGDHDPLGEGALARAMRRGPPVYLACSVGQVRQDASGELRASSLELPPSRLAAAAAGVGHDGFPELDGWTWPVLVPGPLTTAAGSYPALSRLLAAHLGPEAAAHRFDPAVHLDHPGRPGVAFDFVDAADVLDGVPAALAACRGRLVLVGGTATGLFTRYRTPQGFVPPVALQAAAVHSLSWPRPVTVTGPSAALVAAVGCGLVVGLGGISGPGAALLASLLLAATAVAASLWAFVLLGVLLPAVDGALAALVAGVVVVVMAWSTMGLQARRTETLLATVFDALPVGVVVTDEAFRVTLVNPAAGRLVPGAGSGVPVAEALAAVPPLVAAHGAYAAEPSLLRVVDVDVGGEGHRVRSFRVLWVPMSSPRGLYGHVCLLDEVTEVRVLYERLRREDRLAHLGRFAAGVVHEIRSPLQSVKTSCEVLVGALAEPDLVELARTSVGEIDRLMGLASELLAFAGPGGDEGCSAAVGDAVAGVAGLVRPVVRAKGVRIEAEVAPGLPAVAMRGARLRQVLLNLVNNATEALAGEGQVTIRASRGASGDVVELAVHDTGSGMDESTLAHIFEPFFTNRPGGTGLGLFLVETYVEEAGGEVRAESRPGEGTTVRVVLPVAAP